MFTLIGSEGAVTLVPAYLKSFPVAGVAMVPLSDTKATWDFLVVWQRGRAAKSLPADPNWLSADPSTYPRKISVRTTRATAGLSVNNLQKFQREYG